MNYLWLIPPLVVIIFTIFELVVSLYQVLNIENQMDCINPYNKYIILEVEPGVYQVKYLYKYFLGYKIWAWVRDDNSKIRSWKHNSETTAILYIEDYMTTKYDLYLKKNKNNRIPHPRKIYEKQ